MAASSRRSQIRALRIPCMRAVWQIAPLIIRPAPTQPTRIGFPSYARFRNFLAIILVWTLERPGGLVGPHLTATTPRVPPIRENQVPRVQGITSKRSRGRRLDRRPCRRKPLGSTRKRPARPTHRRSPCGPLEFRPRTALFAPPSPGAGSSG